MRESGGNYLKYLKRGWNRKEERGDKDFKNGGQAGSRGRCLNKGGGWNPLTNYGSARRISSHLIRTKLRPPERRVGFSRSGSKRYQVCLNVYFFSYQSTLITFLQTKTNNKN